MAKTVIDFKSLPVLLLFFTLLIGESSAGEGVAISDTASIEIKAPAYEFLTFDFLAGYDYMPPPGYLTANGRSNPDGSMSIWDRLPESVMELDGRAVIISGYMVPIEYENEGLKSFVLRRKPEDCCPDERLAPNQFIIVESTGNNLLEYYMNIPVVVQGRFNIREVIEGDLVVSLYHLKAGRVFPDKD